MPVLFWKLAAPLYSAVMVCVPDVRLEVVSWARPFAFSVTGKPMLDPLSLNWTTPVGMPAAETTVAVKVTDWFKSDGLADEVMVVVVGALPIVNDCGTFAAAL